MSLTLGHVGFEQPSNKNNPFNVIFKNHIEIRSYLELKNCDALVLWGGADISPSLYKETPIKNGPSGPKWPNKRDLIEWEAISDAVKFNIPIIGVCRGAQMLCAFAGGKLIQDCVNHKKYHDIDTYNNNNFNVSSVHHQMMYPHDTNHEMLAWSTIRESMVYQPLELHLKQIAENKVEPEVVFFPKIRGMAIQCHPEYHLNNPFNTWINNEIKERFFK